MLHQFRQCTNPDVFQDVEGTFEDAKYIYVMTIYCERGDLFDLLGSCEISLQTVQRIMSDILKSLDVLHNEMMICHRDISLENVFITNEWTARLGDFAQCRPCVDEEGRRLHFRGRCGKPATLCPEAWLNENYSGTRADIFASGVILFAMLYRALPWRQSSESDERFAYYLRHGLQALTSATPLKLAKPATMETPSQTQARLAAQDLAKDLLSKLLSLRSDRRPSVREALAHPFFNWNGGSCTVIARSRHLKAVSDWKDLMARHVQQTKEGSSSKRESPTPQALAMQNLLRPSLSSNKQQPMMQGPSSGKHPICTATPSTSQRTSPSKNLLGPSSQQQVKQPDCTGNQQPQVQNNLNSNINNTPVRNSVGQCNSQQLKMTIPPTQTNSICNNANSPEITSHQHVQTDSQIRVASTCKFPQSDGQLNAQQQNKDIKVKQVQPKPSLNPTEALKVGDLITVCTSKNEGNSALQKNKDDQTGGKNPNKSEPSFNIMSPTAETQVPLSPEIHSAGVKGK